MPKKKTRKQIAVDKAKRWTAGEDNGNPPLFTGNDQIFVTGSEPIDFFNKLFPDSLRLTKLFLKTNRYAFQYGNSNFKISKEEIQLFIGIKIIMTYKTSKRSDVLVTVSVP